MERIGDYILLKVLANCSFGNVYLSNKNGAYFAIKKIGRNYIDKQDLIRCIDNETHIWYKLNHPNICKVHGILKTKDYYAIVMEYINGWNLSDCMENYDEKFSEQIVQ